MELKLFPWENNESPYWINPENGIEWYVDKPTTRCCRRDRNGWKKLDAVVLYVAERKGDKVNAIERILIDTKTNNVLAAETSLETMIGKIEMLRLALTD
jgi:hypothetical protein